MIVGLTEGELKRYAAALGPQRLTVNIPFERPAPPGTPLEKLEQWCNENILWQAVGGRRDEELLCAKVRSVGRKLGVMCSPEFAEVAVPGEEEMVRGLVINPWAEQPLLQPED